MMDTLLDIVWSQPQCLKNNTSLHLWLSVNLFFCPVGLLVLMFVLVYAMGSPCDWKIQHHLDMFLVS